MSYLIYSVEDDSDIARIINLTLTKQGYTVETFSTGSLFLTKMKEKKPDLLLLDLMLPDYNGFDIIRKIRSDKSNDEMQIMIVSAKNQIIDKVDGLDLGADDYLEKPFDILELISRVSAKFRRYENQQVVESGNLRIDNRKHICQIHDKEISLTNAEFTILFTLMKKNNQVVSRDELLSKLWGDSQACESRTIDVHINSLRSKLGEEGKKIVAVYGIGYRFVL
ncbi:MAG: response regulator transcription factor [Bacilli bacterium]